MFTGAPPPRSSESVPRRLLFRVGRGRPRAGRAPPAHIAFAEGSASARSRWAGSNGNGRLAIPCRRSAAHDRRARRGPVPRWIGARDRRILRCRSPFADASARHGRAHHADRSGRRGSGERAHYQVDTPVASASTDGPGEYRVALLSGPAGLEAELAVLRGLASLRTEQGSTPVRAGERSLARDLEAPSFPHTFNSARFDAFDRWSALRRDARMGTAQSSQYLPRELQMYGGTFDRYGAWQHEPQYGYVWYPSASPGWRPVLQRLLVGEPPVRMDMDWPGRLGMADASLRPLGHLAQPLVLDSGASVGALVGDLGSGAWLRELVPAGFDNRPVFALSANVGNPWLGWVVVPRTHFGAPGTYVHRHAVPHLPATAPVVHARGGTCPAPRGAAGDCGDAGTGDAAVPRGLGRDVAVQRGSGYAAYGRPGPRRARTVRR